MNQFLRETIRHFIRGAPLPFLRFLKIPLDRPPRLACECASQPHTPAIIYRLWFVRAHRENQYVEQAAINTIGKPMRSAGGFFVSELRQSAHKTSHSSVFLARAELCEVREAGWRNSETNLGKIWVIPHRKKRPPPWLNLRRNPARDFPPLHIVFLCGPALH